MQPQVPALSIFETSLRRGKFDDSRKLSDGSLMEFAKVYPLDAVFDKPEDVPEDVRTPPPPLPPSRMHACTHLRTKQVQCAQTHARKYTAHTSTSSRLGGVTEVGCPFVEETFTPCLTASLREEAFRPARNAAGTHALLPAVINARSPTKGLNRSRCLDWFSWYSRSTALVRCVMSAVDRELHETSGKLVFQVLSTLSCVQGQRHLKSRSRPVHLESFVSSK